MFVEAVFKQQKREKRHALQKVNYEYEVEKVKEKNRVFLEINHLKILMGTFYLQKVFLTLTDMFLHPISRVMF